MSNFIEDFSEKVTLTDNDLMIIADSQANNQNKKVKQNNLFNYLKNKLKILSFNALNISAGDNSLMSENCIAFGDDVIIPKIMNSCQAFNSANTLNLPASNNFMFHGTILNNILKGVPDESFIISSPANNQSEFAVTSYPCIFKIIISAFIILVDKSGIALEKCTFDSSGYIDLENRSFNMSEMKNIISLKEQEGLIPFCTKLRFNPSFVNAETYNLILNIPNFQDLALNWFKMGSEAFKDFKIYSSFVIRTQEIYGFYLNKKG